MSLGIRYRLVLHRMNKKWGIPPDPTFAAGMEYPIQRKITDEYKRI
ncbi:MAG: hypothetical protein RSD12_02430 [Akkermansia sp.]